ncbi:IucA/IucC family protein [Nocardioides solisilvae]|uniref:IucA/IucC family protein n=1 Tax=Nocardioides solisilvae TaxID=1542435 RepID=UPI000D74671D|nr:IucA/IucC family protein [Nocardioides solisilvae]
MRYDEHLTPELMARAQRHLVAKAIAELSHERLLAPEPVPPPVEEVAQRRDHYALTTPDGRARYTFTARVLPLEHWVVDEASLARTVDGEACELDAQELVAELAPDLGIPDALLPVYLEELASTLSAAAWKLAQDRPSVTELLDAGYQEIEAAMTEGHPGFVANNGRIGFGADDYAAYAPEAGRDVRLLWLAVRKDQSRLSLARGLGEEEHYRRELGEATLAAWRDRLAGLGLDPAAYRFLPLHPWQWVDKVAVTFAPSVARRDVVLLGEGPGAFRAQQSIRTFFPVDHPERSYVKTALAIQNMGFLRGLSPAYMGPTPAINDWVADLVAADPTLVDCGFTVLREHAAIGWTGDVFHRIDTPSAHRKMVAALWRESPVPGLAEGERLATMASLLHRDPVDPDGGGGASHVAALVRASGLEPAAWVRGWLRAYLRPLVHCLLAHDLAFMPHGENLVLVLRDHVVVRAIMKDVGEEVAVMGDAPLPPEVERIRASVPVDEQSLTIHTDVFDGVLRHVAGLLHTEGVLDVDAFWAEVARCLDEHAADHADDPEVTRAVARHDLRRPRFRHSCLNRLQLRNTLQMVDLTDQAQSLLYAGTLANPCSSAEPSSSAELVEATA